MGEQAASTDGPRPGDTAAQLFSELWGELTAVLGTAATATLVRRAIKRASPAATALQGLRVIRDGWDYRYELPPAWAAQTPAAAPELAVLVRSGLAPILREFTGEILVRRLERVPGLARLGVAAVEEP